MPFAITPHHLTQTFADSTDEWRRALVLGLLRSVRAGETRDEALAWAEGAGWSREFAAWVYTKVRQDGEIEILGPLDERVRAAKMAPPLIVSHAPWVLVAVVAFVILDALLGASVGFVLVPSLWGFWRLGRHLFARRETGEGEWITPE